MKTNEASWLAANLFGVLSVSSWLIEQQFMYTPFLQIAQLQTCSSKSGKHKQKLEKRFFQVAFVLGCAPAS